jgi:methylmalonyl-CoA mutase N-terminal domain/subunit
VRFHREVEARRRIIVGVNDYVSGEQQKVPILQMDVEGCERQIRRLNEVRHMRDNRAVSQRLNELAQAARQDGKNLMPPILGAVNEYATLQEMMDVLRDAWGVYEEPVIL